MELDLQTAASWAEGQLVNGGGDLQIAAVSTDSRTLEPGALFIALPGEKFDGGKFVGAAFAKGAAAALVSNAEQLEGRPGIVVRDPVYSLGRLAHQYRWQRHLIPWIAVTGSNGKTTTRSLTAHILRSAGQVLEPQANFNNLIGMPLTILRNDAETRFGVLEMGTSNPGEIRRLAEIASPTVAVITGVAPAHLQGLGSVEGVAREKAAISDRLPQDGLAVLPAQGEFLQIFREHVPHGVQQITFGVETHADVVAQNVELAENGSRFTVEGQQFFLPLLGRHNISNCLAALIAARRFGVNFAQAAAALESFQPVQERLQVTKYGNITVIDDAYNANPESVMAAVRVLADYPAERRVLVIGDMGELGDRSRELHASIGKWLAQMPIDMILAVGKESLAVAENATAKNARQIIRYFPSVLSLIGHLKTTINSGDAILIKGSHFMNLGRVVSTIKMLRKK